MTMNKKQHSANNNIKRTDLTSGEDSRIYRKKIASFADRQSDVTQTVKFKLERKPNFQLPSFTQFRNLYGTLEGTEKGSLTYLLFSLVVSGFRLFSSSKEAVIYCKRSGFQPAEFATVTERVFSKPLPDFTPTKIVNRIRKPIKDKVGDDKTLTPQKLFTAYKNEWAYKIEDAKFDELLNKIVQLFVDHYSSSKEIVENADDAIALVDIVLVPEGFPSLKAMMNAGGQSVPTGSSIVFDANVPYMKPNADLNPYCAVASLLQTYDWTATKDTSKQHVKERLTTGNNNALSWLFNKGLTLLKDTALTGGTDANPSLDQLFGVPQDRIESLKLVKEAAQAIDQQNFLLTVGGNVMPFSEFRSSFGGHIDSWTSNYINRLVELNDLMTNIPASLTIPAEFINESNQDFIVNAGLLRSEVETAVSQFASIKTNAMEALNKLCGKTTVLPQQSDLDKIRLMTASINRLNAIYQSLNNSMEQAKKTETSIWYNLHTQLSSDWDAWKKLKNLPKLNDLSGGVPDAKATLKKISEDFSKIHDIRRKVHDRVFNWAKTHCQQISVIQFLEKKEKSDIAQRQSCTDNPDQFAQEQAARLLLHKIARVIQKSNDAVSVNGRKWFTDQKIFDNQKDFNRFFYNNQGSLYRSVYSNSRHAAFAVNPNVITNIESVWQSFKNFVAEQEKTVGIFSEERTTVLKIENLIDSLELACINTSIPVDIADLELPAEYASALSEEIQLALQNPSINVSLFIKAFNTYNSLLSGFVTQLRRERFFLRTKFLWINNHRLAYVPKAKLWNIPQRSLKTFSPLFEKGLVSLTENSQIDVIQTFKDLTAKKVDNFKDLAKFLCQMPHDWAYLAPFANSDSTVCKQEDKILTIDKGEFCWVKADANRLMRLVGPSSFKTRIDRLLLDPKRYMIGEMTLLVDQPVEQYIEASGNVSLNFDDLLLSIAAPLKESLTKADKENVAFPFKRLVSIDQGEAGLAYAVFDLTEAGNAMAIPIASGAIPIPSIRRLIKGVHKFRKSGQGSNKFNQRFDSTMFNIRENVAGDVTHVIVGLMKKFQAFPVLENQVENLESKSKQLPLVYKAINSRFLFSDVDNHRTIRKNLWFNGETWTVPGLQISKDEYSEDTDDSGTKKKKKTGKVKYADFKIFPGYGVDARFTSQTCSCCGRNIGEMLKKASEDENYQNVTIGENGEAVIYDEIIKLYRPDPDKRKYYLRRNERNPLTLPVGKQTLKFPDFRKLVKSNMRRAPTSLRSHDTSQSQFYCVFADCSRHNKRFHADQNAAINIGRRLLGRLQKKESK